VVGSSIIILEEEEEKDEEEEEVEGKLEGMGIMVDEIKTTLSPLTRSCRRCLNK
jgi:hypothetical protein